MKAENNDLCIYKGQLTDLGFNRGVNKITAIFPNLFNKMNGDQLTAWLGELKEALIDNEFTDERFMDAIKHVRDNFSGWNGSPQMGDFLKYTKTIKVYDRIELQNIVINFSPQSREQYLNKFVAVDIDGVEKLVEKTDQKKYDLKFWQGQRKDVKITGEYKDGVKVTKNKDFSILKHFEELRNNKI